MWGRGRDREKGGTCVTTLRRIQPGGDGGRDCSEAPPGVKCGGERAYVRTQAEEVKSGNNRIKSGYFCSEHQSRKRGKKRTCGSGLKGRANRRPLKKAIQRNPSPADKKSRRKIAAQGEGTVAGETRERKSFRKTYDRRPDPLVSVKPSHPAYDGTPKKTMANTMGVQTQALGTSTRMTEGKKGRKLSERAMATGGRGKGDTSRRETRVKRGPSLHKSGSQAFYSQKQPAN